MDWISYKKKKPTNKESLYLIEYGWTPNIHIIKTARWNGKTFYNQDWEECMTFKYKNQVRYWFEIEEPKEEKK